MTMNLGEILEGKKETEEKEIPGFLKAWVTDGRHDEALYFDPFAVRVVKAVKQNGPTFLSFDNYSVTVNGSYEAWVREIAMYKLSHNRDTGMIIKD